MDALEIASIVFASTAANHLGLVAAIEDTVRFRLPVVNCPKCLAFWLTMAYGGYVCCDAIADAPAAIVTLLAVSFLAAWSAVWLDLAMGLIDKIYLYAYGKIYPATGSTDADETGTNDTVPGLQQPSGS